MPPLSHGLALDKDAASRFLPWLVAVMVYLSGLALIGATAMSKLSERWSQSLDGQVTIQLPSAHSNAPAPEDDPALAALLAEARETPGVASAELVAQEDMARLLEPWLGPADNLQDLPLPRLVAVELTSADASAVATLKERLAPLLPEDALIEDHQRWLQNFLGLVHSLELAATIVVALIGFSAIALIALVTRMSLAVHQPVIELLHLMGAQDAFVARQFQFHALKFGLIGGFAGLAGAALTLLTIEFMLSRLEGGLFDALAASHFQWGVLVMLPILAAAIAMLTARVTVLRNLTRLH